MTDLSLAASHDYWRNYDDPMIYRVVAFMEGVERWTLDGNPELESILAQLGKEFDDIDNVDLGELGEEEAFIRIAANVKSSRALRLLQAIDTAQPGSASRLLIHAEETSMGPDDPAGIFLRRNIVFERLRLLARVFSKERMNFILQTLEGEEFGD